jgi:hypothetical protein
MKWTQKGHIVQQHKTSWKSTTEKLILVGQTTLAESTSKDRQEQVEVMVEEWKQSKLEQNTTEHQHDNGWKEYNEWKATNPEEFWLGVMPPVRMVRKSHNTQQTREEEIDITAPDLQGRGTQTHKRKINANKKQDKETHKVNRNAWKTILGKMAQTVTKIAEDIVAGHKKYIADNFQEEVLKLKMTKDKERKQRREERNRKRRKANEKHTGNRAVKSITGTKRRRGQKTLEDSIHAHNKIRKTQDEEKETVVEEENTQTPDTRIHNIQITETEQDAHTGKHTQYKVRQREIRKTIRNKRKRLENEDMRTHRTKNKRLRIRQITGTGEEETESTTQDAKKTANRKRKRECLTEIGDRKHRKQRKLETGNRITEHPVG